MEAYKLLLNTGSPKEAQDRKFDRIRAVFEENGAHCQRTGITWKFQGKQCCRKFWIQCTGQASNLLKQLRRGHTTRPEAAPRLPKPEPALDRVNVWLLDCYQHLADPLASPGNEDVPAKLMEHLEDPPEILDDVAHPLYALSFNVGTDDKRRMAGRREAKHVTGAVLFRVCEMFFLLPVDNAKDCARQRLRATAFSAPEKARNFVYQEAY